MGEVITGHKSVASINSYSELPEERHKKISKILTSKKQVTVESNECAKHHQPAIESSLNVESGDYDTGRSSQIIQKEQLQLQSEASTSRPNFNLGLDLFKDDFNFDEAQWTELFKQTDSKPTFTNCTFNNCTFKM